MKQAFLHSASKSLVAAFLCSTTAVNAQSLEQSKSRESPTLADVRASLDPAEAARLDQLDAIDAQARSPTELIAAKDNWLASLPTPVAQPPSPEAHTKQIAQREKIAAIPGPEGDKARLALEITDSLEEVRQEKSPADVIAQLESFQSLNGAALAELPQPLPSDLTSVPTSIPADPVFGEVQAALSEIRALKNPAALISQLEEFQRLNEASLAELARPPDSQTAQP